MENNPWLHPTYLLRRQLLRMFGGGFEIYDPQGTLAFYSEQKAFKLKEDIRLFTDKTKAVELLVIKARKALDISSQYDVYDSVDQERVGVLVRRGIKSILRDEWDILDDNERPLGKIMEDSTFWALVRRSLTNLVPQSFTLRVGESSVGTFKQNANIFAPKLRLDFSMDAQNRLDRRLGIAAAILLCAVEGRQQ